MGKWQSKCTGYIDVTSVKQLGCCQSVSCLSTDWVRSKPPQFLFLASPINAFVKKGVRF